MCNIFNSPLIPAAIILTALPHPCPSIIMSMMSFSTSLSLMLVSLVTRCILSATFSSLNPLQTLCRLNHFHSSASCTRVC